MKKNKLCRFLLTWLLALVMVLGNIVTDVAPVYAAEDSETSDTGYKYSYEYQVCKKASGVLSFGYRFCTGKSN